MINVWARAFRFGVALGCLSLAACQPPKARTDGATGAASDTIIPPGLDDGASTDLPSGILDRHALVRFIRAADSFTPADEFSPGFDDTAIRGRRFHIVLTEGDPMLPPYFYNADRHRLSLSQSTDYQDGFDFIALYNKEEQFAPKTEGNAFGATVDVTPKKTTTFGVGSEGCRLGLFKDDHGLCRDLTRNLDMSGDKARAAVSGIVSEIDGVVTVGKNGRAVQCSSGHQEATISSPREVDTHTCILSARITKVVFRSPSAGVLAAWPTN